MPDEFGNLSKSEELFVYGKFKPAKQTWTIRHALPSVFSLNPENKPRLIGPHSGSVSKSAALRSMNKRNKQIVNFKDLMHKIKDDSTQSKERCHEACILLEEFCKTEHIRTSRAFCFRMDLSSSTPYSEKNPRYILHLQSKLQEMGIIAQNECFVSRKSLLSLAPFLVIHMDVTQKALFAPGFSVNNMTIWRLHSK